MRRIVGKICGLAVIATVILAGLFWYFKLFGQKIPDAVSLAQINGERNLKYSGKVADESDVYFGLEKYSDDQYVYYFDTNQGVVRAVECLTEPLGETAMTQNMVKNQAVEYVNTVLERYVDDTVVWEENSDNGLYEISMMEFKNGEVTGTSAYCVYNNAGNLIAATFSVSKTAENASGDDHISKEYAYGIFASYLAQQYEGEPFLEDMKMEDCEITQTVARGVSCWNVQVQYTAWSEDLVTLQDGRLFSGYGALIDADSGKILSAGEFK